ncbi:MAG: hypothetical protein ACSLFR_03190 [Solirubrobacteraceae bacterium]
MAAMPQPQPEPRALPDARAATGVTLRVDFSTGRILGPVDPADLHLTRASGEHDAELTDLPRRRPE